MVAALPSGQLEPWLNSASSGDAVQVDRFCRRTVTSGQSRVVNIKTRLGTSKVKPKV